MAISKLSALINQYREFSLAIDSYDNKKITGRIYHASRTAAIPFEGLIEMVRFLEIIFDEIHYPMPSMDQRNFNKAKNFNKIELRTVDSEQEEMTKGRLMTVRLSIKHRYNASWQGTMKFLESGEEYGFISFLELVKLLNKYLLGEQKEKERISGDPICRITVDEYNSHCLEGNVHQAASAEKLYFCSVIQLMEHMDRMIHSNQASSKVMTNQAFGVYREKGKKATFVVRILFLQNGSWQGKICWKDTAQIMNFRSFLELIKLIDTALLSVETWNEEDERAVK